MAESDLPRQRTSFVGRQQDLEDIAKQLNNPACQLLTLTGPGGVGKTRLALEAAARLHETFADGVYFVPLAPLTSAEDILTAVMGAVPFKPYEGHDPKRQLLDYLSTKHLLLVMDNFEHLLKGVMLVNEIIDAASQVKVLVTSRESLNLQEEWVWRVRGMAVPDKDTDQIEGYSAVQLFLDRAQRVQRDFSITDEGEYVVRICQLVEGLPLALEIAAAWLKSLPCQAIANQIERNIDFLTASAHNTPDRHRSIRAVFDHSWQMLTENERVVFTGLTVFRGGFTIEAATHVAGATLINLTALADKSLIQPGIGQRYDIHELLRQYGVEKLAGDRDSLDMAHATYFAHFLSQRESDLKGRRQKAALDEIAADYDNIRTAWVWAVQAYRHDLIKTMIMGYMLFTYMRDRLAEFVSLVRLALTHFQLQLNPTDPDLLQLLLLRPHLNFNMLPASENQESKQTSYERLQRTLQLLEPQDQPALVAIALKMMGHFHEGYSEFEDAIGNYEQSLDRFRQLDDPFYMSWILGRLGVCYTAVGRWEQAQECTERSLLLSREIGNTLHAARALHNLGIYALYHAHDLVHAHHYFEEAIVEQREIDNRMGIALASIEVGYMAFLQGDADKAAHLAAEVLSIANQISRTEIQSVACALQAQLAVLDGDDITGQHLAMLSLDQMRIQYPITVFWAQMALNMAVQGHNKPGESQQLLDKMLQQASQVQSPLLCACCLPFSALLAHEKHPERAVELLALAVTQLSTASGWLERWQTIAYLRQQLKDELGAETFQTLWDRGARLNLDTTIAGLSGHIDDVQKTQPGLVEPLSEREREILQLIAEDLSNHEIAERLFITVGTVKSHNNHIFSKLAARNRTEAVVNAQALGLL